MSRIDDDRDAQKLLERIALKQREDARRTQERKEGDSVFARRMSESSATSRKESVHQESTTADELTLAAEQAEHVSDEEIHEAEARGRDAAREGKARSAGKAFDRQLHKGESLGEDRTRDGRAFAGQQKGAADAGRASNEVRAKGRSDDAKGNDARQEERGSAQSKAGKGGASMERSGGRARADADGGGQGGGHDGDKREGPAGPVAGFRLNPALMAPVPVAQPKDTSSARLRALANEIAQKIVERVRVGTNKDGIAEFQIDLKSSVLSGLSIKLSGSNGKIRALFSGGDKEVLKMLEEQGEGLRLALEGRGLRLEEFKVEARA